jgi:elongation factor G
MGELHLEIIVDRMRRDLSRSQPGRTAGCLQRSVPESIEHREVLKKQTGGRGKFADIVFEFGPVMQNGKQKIPISISICKRSVWWINPT